jgi:hypothetical protein
MSAACLWPPHACACICLLPLHLLLCIQVTVLDKTKMDWQEAKAGDAKLQEELEAHKRSDKQYLERQVGRPTQLSVVVVACILAGVLVTSQARGAMRL